MFVLVARKSLNINELRARAGENNAKKKWCSLQNGWSMLD